MGLDFMRTDDGLVIIECNPRSTIGLALLPGNGYVEAILGNPVDPIESLPGERLKIDLALLRDIFQNWRPRDWHEIPIDLAELFSGAPDVYGRKGDIAPLLYVILSLSHVSTYRHDVPPELRTRSDLLAAQFYDIEYDGEGLQ